ncbi:MAG TPA: diaminopimelate decarboxylase [Firmicutes bacterium]|nr:diaminopimelate decarboxylase [Bacillota bacterium]
MGFYGTMRINEKGHLEIGGCDTVDLARVYGTPLYVMDEAAIRQECRAFRRALESRHADSEVIYAGKAFSTMAMCRIADEEGLGLDVASGGEIVTALKAGFPAERIYFHGNNKSRADLEMALRARIGRFMVDNLYELEMLHDLARQLRVKAHVDFRVTPGVEAHTHEYIRTGQLDSKFGLGLQNGQAMMAVEKALAMDGIVVHGLHCHIGSQIFELESFKVACEIMMDFIAKVRRETGFTCEELNLGGGLGVRYVESDVRASVEDYASLVIDALYRKAREHNLPVPRLLVEPGRYIVGQAGTTLYTVGSIKDIPGIRKYVAVDGGYTDNPRVALYGARYHVIVANKANYDPVELVTIAGRCCESGDMLAWDVRLPRLEPGDILAFLTTGAYHYSMSSNYNRFARPAVVFVRDGEADLVVERESYEDVAAHDRIPQRLLKHHLASVR